MRRIVSMAMVSGLAIGCSVFGADAPGEQPPAGSPQDNAQPPPVDGSPIAGVYVSTSLGSDEAPGTAGRPVKTLKKAFALANEQHLRVIACAETYEEDLTLIDGVSAYGYYECAAMPWKRGERRATVKAPVSPAVLARGLTLPTRLEGFAIHAPDLEGALAKEGKTASIALEVRDSRELIVSDSLLHAGTGARGEDGTEGAINVETGTSTGGAGTPEKPYTSCAAVLAEWVAPGGCASLTTIAGGAGGLSTCAVGPSGGPGGDGGNGTWFNPGRTSSPGRTSHGRPLVATANTSVGGAEMLPGGPGTTGKAGVDGANGAWSLTAAGFATGDGTAGTNGGPGAGGGGGGGADDYRCAGGACSPGGAMYFYSASGAGGGAGGCAGLAGTPATGGGATIGALAIKSAITFERTRIETATGGRGGKGTLGSAGLAGGGVQTGTTYSGTGLGGGAGGTSGLSGHGAPGPAIALAYAGTRPLTTAVELAPGDGGAGFPELRKGAGAGAKVLPAVRGDTLPEYEIKP